MTSEVSFTTLKTRSERFRCLRFDLYINGIGAIRSAAERRLHEWRARPRACLLRQRATASCRRVATTPDTPGGARTCSFLLWTPVLVASDSFANAAYARGLAATEKLVALLQQLCGRPVLSSSRPHYRLEMNSLQSMPQHRAVPRFHHVMTNLDHQIGTNSDTFSHPPTIAPCDRVSGT